MTDSEKQYLVSLDFRCKNLKKENSALKETLQNYKALPAELSNLVDAMENQIKESVMLPLALEKKIIHVQAAILILIYKLENL